MEIDLQDNNMWDSVNSLKQNYENAKKEFQIKGELALKTVFDGLFDKYPFLNSLNWTAYTPYFCDGDPCIFGVNEIQFTLGPNDFNLPEWNEDDYDGYAEWQSGYTLKTGPVITTKRIVKNWRNQDEERTYTENSYPNPVAEALGEDITKLNSIMQGMSDILLDVYGDHVKVTVTRDGTDIETYEHD